MKTILLIEDESELRSLMAEELRDMGFRVAEAENGRVALDMARMARPDLVLCDLAMPVMSGQEFLAAYMQDDAHAAVVILSAFGTRDEVDAAYAAGATNYLRKPVDFEELRQVLQHIS